MYVHWCRFDEGTNVMQNLFWTHSDLVKLLNVFNTVLMMDNTYKTNKYMMLLLEVVGITSMRVTLHLCYSYLNVITLYGSLGDLNGCVLELIYTLRL